MKVFAKTILDFVEKWYLVRFYKNIYFRMQLYIKYNIIFETKFLLSTFTFWLLDLTALLYIASWYHRN